MIDDKVRVSEEEIKNAIRLMAHYERFIIEGAAGVALAGFLKHASRYKGKKVVVVLCGRNIVLETFLNVVHLNPFSFGDRKHPAWQNEGFVGKSYFI